MTDPGWRSLSGPRVGREAFVTSPFARLARSHALAVAGDTLVAIALAGTLFFSIDPDAARREVFLYLALTMAPFAIVAPLVGPALDRASGGRRWMVVLSSTLRAVICLLMIDDVDSLLLFPEAFLLLVLAKSYHVAKSSLVPSTVRSDEELVEANSKLSLISGFTGFVAAIPGGILLQLGGSEWVLGLAAIVFAVGIFVSWRIPRGQVAGTPETEEARDELRSAGVLLAASAMALLRGVVGFLVFLLAFSLRTGGAPTWHFGVVLALSAVGSTVGAGIAPLLRQQATEEKIITIVLGAVATCAAIGAWMGGLAGAALVAVSVGIGAASAKQAFDAIVQRDAPDANRGRSFARFETRFQLVWVAGAVIGVIPMPTWLGFLGITGLCVFGAVSYIAGARGARRVTDRRRSRTRRRTAQELGFYEAPTRELPPTIVSPQGQAPESPPAPAPPPPEYPPGVATPTDATDVYRSGADPTLVDDDGGSEDERSRPSTDES
ncbi:MAG: MFS transporter [Acidimicrobiales bacterium]|nr:MFS transporter [Acidimicrobiales bacterium]